MTKQIKNSFGFSLMGILVTMGISSAVLGGAIKIVDISVEMSSLAKSSQSEKSLKHQVSHLLSSPEECKTNLKPHRLSGKQAGKGLGSLNRLTSSQKTLFQIPGVFDGRLEVVKMDLTRVKEDKSSDPKKSLSRRVFSLYYKKTNLKNQQTQGMGTCSSDNTEACYFMQCLLNYQLEDVTENPQVTHCEALSCLNVAGGTYPECYTVDEEEDLKITSLVGSKINRGRTLVGCGKSFEVKTSHTTAFGWGAGAQNTTGLYNTFAGYRAGMHNTTGSKNTFSGFEAGFYNQEASMNTYVGFQAGKGKKRDPKSKAPQGGYNTFFGSYAGHSNTQGESNTFAGFDAGRHNTTGSHNTFMGISSGYKNEKGHFNTFLGTYTAGRPEKFTFALGDHNIFIGACAGYNIRSDKDTKYNIFLGQGVGFNNHGSSDNCLATKTDGIKNSDALGAGNIFIGTLAGGKTLTTGDYNIFTGYKAGWGTSEGEKNVFIGHEAGFNNTKGSYNTFIGRSSGFNNKGDKISNNLQDDTEGRQNTFFGWESGYGCGSSHAPPKNHTEHVPVHSKANTCSESRDDTKTGSKWEAAMGFKNVFIGSRAGYKFKKGTKNVFIGNRAGRRFKSGYGNTILGAQAGRGHNYHTSDSPDGYSPMENTYLGSRAGHSNIKGNRNTFIGYAAGYLDHEGQSNTYMGAFSGQHNRKGKFNIYIGPRVGPKILIPNHLAQQYPNGLPVESAIKQNPDTAANAGVKRDGSYQLNIGNLLIGKMPKGVASSPVRINHLPGGVGVIVNGNLCVKDSVLYGKSCENNLTQEIGRLKCKTGNISKIVQMIKEGKALPSLNPGDSC